MQRGERDAVLQPHDAAAARVAVAHHLHLWGGQYAKGLGDDEATSRSHLGGDLGGDLGAISEVISGRSRIAHLIRPSDRRVTIRVLRLDTHLHGCATWARCAGCSVVVAYTWHATVRVCEGEWRWGVRRAGPPTA